MNWVDLVILLVVLIFAIEGQRRGFFIQLFDIIGFFISLLCSLTFYPQAAAVLIKVFHLPKIAANPIGFLIIWLIIETIFFSVFSGVIKKFIAKYMASPVNKLLGFFPATLNGLLFLSFILLFVVSLPIRPDIKKGVFDSKTGSFLVDKASAFEKPFNSIFGPIAKQSLTFLTVSPDEKECLQLEFKQPDNVIDETSEQEMLVLVNKERTTRGFTPLVIDERLQVPARSHSADMFARGYFCHYSPENKDVGNRLEENGIEYSVAGENLALAPDVIRAHNGLINSEGHKRNILDPAFKKIGIGAIDGGVYGRMFTQVFTN